MSTTVTTPPKERAAAHVRTFLDRHSSMMPTFAALLIFIVLLIVAQVHFGNFVTPLNMSALLLDNAYLLILAVGMTFVIVTGGIDLSVGSVMAFTGISAALLLGDGYSAVVVVPVIILGGAAIGLLIGVLVQYFDVQPFIASLAGLFLARGLAFVVSLSSIRVENDSVLWLQTTRWRLGDWYITPTGILALSVAALGAFVMQFTRFGRTVYAVGGNEQSARLMGLNVARTKVLVYVISGTVRRSRRAGADGVLRRRLPTQRHRHRARRDRGRGHRRHAAHRRHRLRARLGDRRARLRHHQDDDLVPGRRAVVDPDHHRPDAADVHRGATGDRGPLGASKIVVTVPGDNGRMDRPLLELNGATVYFGADAALDGVDFRLFPGEVHSADG